MGLCHYKKQPIAELSLGSGDDLLFRAVSRQVPSALKGLTSVFGMDTGDPLRLCHRKLWLSLGLARGLSPVRSAFGLSLRSGAQVCFHIPSQPCIPRSSRRRSLGSFPRAVPCAGTVATLSLRASRLSRRRFRPQGVYPVSGPSVSCPLRARPIHLRLAFASLGLPLVSLLPRASQAPLASGAWDKLPYPLNSACVSFARSRARKLPASLCL